MNVKKNTLKDSVSALPQKFAKSVPAQLTALGIVIFVLCGFLWLNYLHKDTTNVFNGMLRGSLSTAGVTKTVSEKSEGSDFSQITQLQLGAENFSRGRTRLTQEVNGQANIVVTETIGTPNADFVRYADIQVPNDPKLQEQYKKASGIWGKSITTDDGSFKARYFSEALLILGIVPIGNVSASQREGLLTYLKDNKVYTIDPLKPIKKETIDGRQMYVYPVKLKLQAYVTYLQKFAGAIGLGEVPGLDPAAYANAPDTALEMAIDPLSRQLVRVTYSDNPNRKETYSAYGVVTDENLPEQTVSLSELQSKVQLLQ